MKNEHSAMHINQTCWNTNSSPIKSSPLTTFNTNQPLSNEPNQINQLNQIHTNHQQSITNHSRESFSSTSDQSIIASDYSFNTSSNSTNSSNSTTTTANNNLVTSTMNSLHLIDQISIPITQAPSNQQINTQIYPASTKTSHIQTHVNDHHSIRNHQNLPRSFNDLPTPGKDKNRVTKKK